MTEANSINAGTTGIVGNTGTAFTGTAVTQYNVLVGAATSSTLSNIAPSATSGVPLISQGASSNPTFGTAVVAGGGTGAVTLTGVLIGNGTSAVTGNAVTQHDILVGGSSNAITSVAPSATSGVPVISQGASADPTFGTAVVAGGGTGSTSFNINGPVISNTTTTGVLSAVTLATQQFLVGNSGAPTAKSLSIVRQVFTSTGTYTPTAGMIYCDIEVVGGGGGGGGCAQSGATKSSAGGGGGGGGYARGIFSAATIGASKGVTIGAAGTAGTAGNNAGGTGGTTSVATIGISATGGTGGNGAAAGTAASGTVGGSGSGGDFQTFGTPGMSGNVFYTATAQSNTQGGGGSSYFGGGAAGDSTASGGGRTANSYGGGGAGGGDNSNSGNNAGGAGAKGVVIITEYVIA